MLDISPGRNNNNLCLYAIIVGAKISSMLAISLTWRAGEVVVTLHLNNLFAGSIRANTCWGAGTGATSNIPVWAANSIRVLNSHWSRSNQAGLPLVERFRVLKYLRQQSYAIKNQLVGSFYLLFAGFSWHKRAGSLWHTIDGPATLWSPT